MPLPITDNPHTFELACATASVTVTLPVPMFGNTQTIQSTRIFRRTTGLRLHVFRDANWSLLNIYEYKFKNVSLAIKDEFITFIEAAGAHVCEIVDHMGIERNMYIINVEPIVEELDNSCSYMLGLTFQEVV